MLVLATGVRTYVHDDQGRSGIWFFSLDAARLPAVAAARASYWLPYFWSGVSVMISVLPVLRTASMASP